MKPCLSPLTETKNVSLVKTYNADDLIHRWSQNFAIEIADEFQGIKQISQWSCNDTGLEFFEPTCSVGSPDLYSQLSRLTWYHEPSRWEFGASIHWLATAQRILEVGCGSGAFLDILTTNPTLDVVGLETNPEAVARSRSRGHNVLEQSLDAKSMNSLGLFDAVCAFQVLEHMPDPRAFLSTVLETLKPGGLLIMSVPNKECFMRHWSVNLLDMPPHHMSRWSEQVLKKLAPLLDIEICCVETETLAAHHSVAFIEANLQRALPQLISKIVARLLGPLLAITPRLRSRLKGHSLLAIYRKRVR